jgi:hypothetical protein
VDLRLIRIRWRLAYRSSSHDDLWDVTEMGDQSEAEETKATPPAEGQRRHGRPPKPQEQDAAEVASLEDLASGES